MTPLAQIGLVVLGSALGGLTRWGVGLAVGHWLGRAFPWGTLVINVTGSFFLGWLLAFVAERRLEREDWTETGKALELLLAVGFAGAYTTFSTFEVETMRLLQENKLIHAAVYVGGSVLAGLLAVFLGMAVARWL